MNEAPASERKGISTNGDKVMKVKGTRWTVITLRKYEQDGWLNISRVVRSEPCILGYLSGHQYI